ncbi:Hypothetical_protein [Hexamita inflata]|uniref:Hypothetical_protein n=1 Tax=Hexamita inflata TaxID=28002 RepID=A0AA86QQ77_9EUKA|nr:Hypothetical protein HINF_LOCUS51484 [Hexamita inflata]
MAILVLKNLTIIIGRILSVSSTQELILFQFTVDIRMIFDILATSALETQITKETLDLMLDHDFHFRLFKLFKFNFYDYRLESTTKRFDPRFGTYRRHTFLKYQT